MTAVGLGLAMHGRAYSCATMRSKSSMITVCDVGGGRERGRLGAAVGVGGCRIIIIIIILVVVVVVFLMGSSF